MFGIDRAARRADTFHRKLRDTFQRRHDINAIEGLVDAFNARPNEIPFSETAIGLDANILVALAKSPSLADVIDYLKLSHSPPTILPGQAVQEFFNIHYSALKSLSSDVKDSFDKLSSFVGLIDGDFGDFAAKFNRLISEFESQFDYIYNPATHERLITLADGLKSFAITSFCPREGMNEIAQDRRQTKTPPGFKDDGIGDFYIWADYLFGLHTATSGGKSFSSAVIVTNDKKRDWSKNSVAHPILRSEMRSLFNVPFETWSVERLIQEVRSQLES